LARTEVHSTFSQSGPRRPAYAGRLTRTLGLAQTGRAASNKVSAFGVNQAATARLKPRLRAASDGCCASTAHDWNGQRASNRASQSRTRRVNLWFVTEHKPRLEDNESTESSPSFGARCNRRRGARRPAKQPVRCSGSRVRLPLPAFARFGHVNSRIFVIAVLRARSGPLSCVHAGSPGRLFVFFRAARPNPSVNTGPATAATAWPLQAKSVIVLPRPVGVRLLGPVTSNVRPRNPPLSTGGAVGLAS